jgi:hypothetical protein
VCRQDVQDQVSCFEAYRCEKLSTLRKKHQKQRLQAATKVTEVLPRPNHDSDGNHEEQRSRADKNPDRKKAAVFHDRDRMHQQTAGGPTFRIVPSVFHGHKQFVVPWLRATQFSEVCIRSTLPMVQDDGTIYAELDLGPRNVDRLAIHVKGIENNLDGTRLRCSVSVKRQPDSALVARH